MKFGVFGNCQATGIADCLRALRPRDKVLSLAAPDIRRMKPREVEAAERAILSCDVFFLQAAVTHPMAKALQAAYPRPENLVTLPVLATHAFHPDCHYVRDASGALINSPIGHYHSGLVTGAFLAGLAQERVAPLFNRFIFEKLGYRQVEARVGECLDRAAAIGYDLTPAIEADPVFMHSINHPKIAVLDAITREGLRKATLDFDEAASLPADKLERDGVFPVYPGLGTPSCDNPAIFRAARTGRTFTLGEFVSESYARLSDCEGPVKTPVAPAILDIIRADVIA